MILNLETFFITWYDFFYDENLQQWGEEKGEMNI